MPLDSRDPDLLARLRADLASSDFTVDRLTGPDAWGASAGAALFRGERVAARRALVKSAARVPSLRPAATLASLFVLGWPQPLADVEAALPTLGAAGAAALGLVEASGDEVRALVDLRPYAFVDASGEASWWIASDLGELALGGALREDHVLGVGGASATLAGLMIPRTVDSALDLGTGCGIQALHVARHARRVVATDISQRALDFAAFNAALNLVDGIEFRLGSLFGPVEGELFDHVVSNPPFVITPRGADVPAYEYRDGGLTGDALVRDIVTGVGAHLTPGGTAQLLGNWEYVDGRDGLHRVRDWVAASAVPLDAWVIERDRMDPIAYAELWIRDGGTVPGTTEFESMLAAWLDDFEVRGVREIGFGYILLRRAQDGTPSLARYERVEGAIGPNAALGMHLATSLRAHDRQARLSDEELAASVLLVAGDVTEARHYLPGAEDPSVIELRQGGGFGRTLAVDPALAALVGASDGDLPVGRLIAAIAELMDVDPQALLADALPRVRALIDDGFLAFADVTSPEPPSPEEPPR